MKTDVSVLEEKSSYKMPSLAFSSKLDWRSYISIAKTASKKIGASIRSTKFFFCISINLPFMEYCCHV